MLILLNDNNSDMNFKEYKYAYKTGEKKLQLLDITELESLH